MKVMIELDVPEGQAIPQAEDILMLTSPDWYADWWHISDIYGASNGDELTHEQAMKVLKYMKKYSDSSVGINWETIEVWADIIRKEKA
jgi:hypothetical protein